MMKRLATLLALLAFSAAPAFATVLLSESFTYANGDLSANPLWTVFSGTPPTDIQVATGRAVCNHSNAPDDHIGFPSQSNTTKVYACFDVIVPPIAGNPKPVYFCMLKDAGTSNFVSRVYVLANNGGLTFGISHTSTSASVGLTPWTSNITAGTKYNIVINSDPSTHSSTLWVNPSSELSPSVTDVNAAFTEVALDHFGLRQSSTASTLPSAQATQFAGTLNAVVSVDNLGVGTTFADACQQYLSTPATRSTWGAVKQIYR